MDHVRIRQGVQRLFGVGGIEVAVDRVTGQRAIVVQVPGGRYPVPIGGEDYLKLGIEIIRDSGVVHDFSESMPEQPPEPPEPPVADPFCRNHPRPDEG